jgi:hypothetical protein
MPVKGVYFIGCLSHKIATCFHDLGHVACSTGDVDSRSISCDDSKVF